MLSALVVSDITISHHSRTKDDLRSLVTTKNLKAGMMTEKKNLIKWIKVMHKATAGDARAFL